MANKINQSVLNFDEFFKSMDFVISNGGYCQQHPDHEDIGIGATATCLGNKYGADQRAKSSAYFTFKVIPEQLNRMTVRNRIEFKCKLFYDCRQYGHRADNYDLALRFHQFIKSKYRIVPRFAVSGDYPMKKVEVIVNVDVYGDCEVTIDEGAAIC